MPPVAPKASAHEPDTAAAGRAAGGGSPPPAARPAALLTLVFLAGTGTMATEIAASRLLAPYYGSSTIVWANLIGLVLASLALGYWIGGRWADRRPSARLLGYIVLTGAAMVAIVPFLARPFLEISVRGIDTVSAGAVVGSFFAALFLFAPPVVMLGMVTPFAIRLATTSVAVAGAVAGRIFALSTAGSLVGTFVPALVTIPLLGTRRTLLLAATILAAAATLVLPRRYLVAPLILLIAFAFPAGVVKPRSGLIHERESRYQFIQVVERGSSTSCISTRATPSIPDGAPRPS